MSTIKSLILQLNQVYRYKTKDLKFSQICTFCFWLKNLFLWLFDHMNGSPIMKNSKTLLSLAKVEVYCGYCTREEVYSNMDF